MKVTVNLVGEYKRIVNAFKTRRPKMTSHRGRTWDYVGRTENGIDVLMDTTWGAYGYFKDANGQWYKFNTLVEVNR